MARRNSFLDASLLRINDGTPVKVTFLETSGKGHFMGFYTIEGGLFKEIRTLFPDVGVGTLIPNVSSVFLGSRLNGKLPVFFVIENGFELNRDAFWFNDAVNGRNGFWKFLTPPEEDGLLPVLEEGEIVWQRLNGETVSSAREASLQTHNPVLVWQSDAGQVFVVKGKIFHSCGFGLYPQLNPDTRHRFLLMPQEETNSVILNFITDDSWTSIQRPEISINLQIGQSNFISLTKNRIIDIALPVPDASGSIFSASIEVFQELDSVVVLDCFENQPKVFMAGTDFLIEVPKKGCLFITAQASPSAYEILLSNVKVRTKTSVFAKSKVRVTFKTEKGEILKTGEIDIFPEKNQISPSFSVNSILSSPSCGKMLSDILPSLNASEKQDDFPSFIKQSLPSSSAVPVLKSDFGNKTALITGGANRSGKEISYALASRGYNVIVHCHDSVAEAMYLVEELRQTYHIKTAYFRADFNSYEETADLLDAVSRIYGSIDLLVCLANTRSSENNAQGWETNMSVNLRAPFVLVNAFARCLPKGRRGNVICVFKEAPDEFSPYALSCLAVRDLTLLAARRFKDQMRVNGLSLAYEKYNENVERQLVNTVCLLAQTTVFDGQIFTLGDSISEEQDV